MYLATSEIGDFARELEKWTIKAGSAVYMCPNRTNIAGVAM